MDMQRTITLIIYLVSAVWLVSASIGRVAIWVESGTHFDALPFIGFGLGVLMLVWITVTGDRNPKDR